MANDEAASALEEIGCCDHSVTREYRIYGPPGSGKTTKIARQVSLAVNKYGADQVLITSFSRSAAAELADREMPVAAHRIGTLHSCCWNALGRPLIAEAHVDVWNRKNVGLPLTPVRSQNKLDGDVEPDDDQENTGRGDILIQRMNRCRGTLLNRDHWPSDVRDFAARWEGYKRSEGLLDFTDLIDVALQDFGAAPGSPAVIVADEGQDLNPMQLALVRKWGGRADYLLIAGDDDQTIYWFAGATPEAMLQPDLPEDHCIFLRESHRLPVKVQEFAEQLIHQVSRRQEKTYRPRHEQGAVHRLAYGYKSPDYAILKSAEDHVRQGRTVMFLASCSYMLRPLIQVLRKNAIPFHNPYRRSNGFWNPIRTGSRYSAAGRARALVAAPVGQGLPWTRGDVALWAEWLRPGVLKKHAAELLRDPDKRVRATPEWLSAIFEGKALADLNQALANGPAALLEWWRNRVRPEDRRRIQFPADVAERRGPTALIDTPSVIVGTIHSVKGGEADVVYLFPDLSRAGGANYQIAGAPRDSIIRLFYVGATRAREALYLCGRETGQAIAFK
ncbi:MAG TPA: ATP-dependent helicase [Bryobacteraceae bacterium]